MAKADSIVELAEEAPAAIPRYPLYDGDQIVGRQVVVSGYGFAGHGATGMDPFFDEVPTKRAGLNRYDAVIDDAFPGVEALWASQPNDDTIIQLDADRSLRLAAALCSHLLERARPSARTTVHPFHQCVRLARTYPPALRVCP